MKSYRVAMAAVALMHVCAQAQTRTISLAYQVTHVDQGSPAISPDGKKILYVAVIAGVEELFTMNLDRSGSTQITHASGNHENPLWSPDGKRIVYSSDKNGRSAIYVSNADGGDEERLSDDRYEYIHPSWSPDGSKVIYCSTDDLHPPQKNPSEIFSLDLKTRKVQTLITGGINTYPALSPDGKKIAFRRIISDMNSEVFLANSDGTDQRNLTNNRAYDGWPAWSPDGSRIAFASNRNGNHRIFVMNADGSNVRPLAPTEGRATEPRWSPDGKTIYFSNCASVAWGTDCQVFAAEADHSAP